MDTVQNVADQSGFRPAIGVDEEEPISRSSGGARIACPGNLTNRLEDDPCAGADRQLSGTIAGAVIHDNQLGLATQLDSRDQRPLNARKRAHDELFFVVGRNDDRELHEIKENTLFYPINLKTSSPQEFS